MAHFQTLRRPPPWLLLGLARVVPVCRANHPRFRRSTVGGRCGAAPRPAFSAGFTDPPQAALQAQSLSGRTPAGPRRQPALGLTKLDAAVSDGYNAVGYWTDEDPRLRHRQPLQPSARGPAHLGETADPAGQQVGRSRSSKAHEGMQAGTSAPAGLVNSSSSGHSTTMPRRSSWLPSSPARQAAIDASRRFGTQREFGLRVNLDARRLDPSLRHANGQAHTAA